jgi:hypothetical protein
MIETGRGSHVVESPATATTTAMGITTKQHQTNNHQTEIKTKHKTKITTNTTTIQTTLIVRIVHQEWILIN